MKVSITTKGQSVTVELEPETTTEKAALDLIGSTSEAKVQHNGVTKFLLDVQPQSVGRAAIGKQGGLSNGETE